MKKAREKLLVTYRESSVRLSADFSSEALEARRQPGCQISAEGQGKSLRSGSKDLNVFLKVYVLELHAEVSEGGTLKGLMP